MSRLTWDFNWKITLSVVIFFPILLSLGIWQLNRAEEKKQLERQWLSQQSLPPVNFAERVVSTEPSFRRVYASGQFIAENYWLLENQIVNGQLGYQVIMIFQSHDQHLLVDRGWVAGSPLRDFVPEFDTPNGTTQISGALVYPSDSKLIREAEVSAKVWPHKILEVDIPVMASQVKIPLYEKLLKIDSDSPAALDVTWRPYNMSATKHIGYAVQWFLMAAALILLFIFSSTNIKDIFKNKHDNE